MKLVSEKFDGNGYGDWKRSMLISLLAKNKLGFFYESIVKPCGNSAVLKAWESCNSMIISWILGVLDNNLARSVLYFSTGREIWVNLEERYGASSGTNLYSLDCTCLITQRMLKSQQDKRLVQFLMKLNDGLRCYKLHGYPPGHFKNDDKNKKVAAALQTCDSETEYTFDDQGRIIIIAGHTQQLMSMMMKQKQDGRRVHITHKGDVQINDNITLKDVLYVEDFKSSLMKPQVLGKLKKGLYYLEDVVRKESVMIQVHIGNDMPLKVLLNKSPYEKLFGVPPNLDYMRAFGCLCFVSTNKQGRTKFDPKDSIHVFIGYIPSQKGYKVLDMDTLRVHVSGDVVFKEQHFFFHVTSQTHTPQNTQSPFFLPLVTNFTPWHDSSIPELFQ
uniref:Uncharacterized protein n=1 Tax=Chenopodium quinoa TaxID=63459 RepID=A0A803N3W4_CHEQI